MNKQELHSAGINDALIFSAITHKMQLRKGTGIPYITHPYAVGMILARAGCSDDVIIAGILHDTVEDGKFYDEDTHVERGVTVENIRLKFGSGVAEIVNGCTEPSKVPGEVEKPWRERKEHTIEHLKEATLEVKMVACADKLHNVNSMLDDYKRIGSKLWKRFNEGRDNQKWYFESLVESFESDDFKEHQLVKEFKQAVDRLFNGG